MEICLYQKIKLIIEYYLYIFSIFDNSYIQSTINIFILLSFANYISYSSLIGLLYIILLGSHP
jgi:hypothetical protein